MIASSYRRSSRPTSAIMADAILRRFDCDCFQIHWYVCCFFSRWEYCGEVSCYRNVDSEMLIVSKEF